MKYKLNNAFLTYSKYDITYISDIYYISKIYDIKYNIFPILMCDIIYLFIYVHVTYFVYLRQCTINTNFVIFSPDNLLYISQARYVAWLIYHENNPQIFQFEHYLYISIKLVNEYASFLALIMESFITKSNNGCHKFNLRRLSNNVFQDILILNTIYMCVLWEWSR